MDEMDQTTISFIEGQSCPLPIAGHGGGLSFSPNGDMLLLAAISNPICCTNKGLDWKMASKADYRIGISFYTYICSGK